MIISSRRSFWVSCSLVAGLAGACGGSDISGAESSCKSPAGAPCVCAGGGSTQCSAASQPLPSAVSGTGGTMRAPDGADAGRPMAVPMPPPVSRLPDRAAMSAGAGGAAPNGPVAGSPPAGSGGAAAAGSGGSGGAAQASTDDVPDGAHCMDVATWDPAWVAFEQDVLRLTNETRARGADCGEEGTFKATTPLTMNAMLRCSARLHSQDMGEREFFDHNNLDGLDPFERMMAAGYRGSALGENIAMGQQTPEEVVQGWTESDGHCANLMSPMFTEIGVGYWEGESDNRFFNGNKLWTQNFGKPQRSGRP